MTPADWRALLEAYLEGRISAEAFARRFMEAWRAARQGGERPLFPIEGLLTVVEAFEAASENGEEGAVDDEDLSQAAARAAAQLGEAPPVAPSASIDDGRAREELRRISVHASGCMGLGCVIGLAWIALCALQVFAVSDQIQSVLDWPAAPATFAGLVLAFVPVIGNLLAFFGAVDVWNWPIWVSALIFFAAPAATLLSAWVRWRRYGRR